MLKKSFSMFLIILLISTQYSYVTHANPGESLEDSESVKIGDTFGDWTLVWHDEFNGNEINPDNWRIDTGNGFIDGNGQFVPGWGNDELQYYQEDNVKVEDGNLVLEARKETVHYPGHGAETFHYTSGKVMSDGNRFNKKYGRFEAKMSLPKGQGFWPAFWMMPANDEYGAWAASGELDIMENAGNSPNKIGGALHYGGEWPNNTFSAKDYYFPEGRDITDFNVYAVEWEPGEIRWYVNDELYQTINNWETTSTGNPAKFAYPAPFDQPFHLILNLAIGGHYGGNPDETTEFPNQVLVDYVRVYELTGRDYREPVEPTFEGAPLPENAKEAVNGNYIYDTGYEKGFTEIRTDGEVESNWNRDYWNFLHLEQFQGLGSVSVESIDHQPFAKIDIENGGNQAHSLQLIQDVTVTTGRWYKLSFDAKSTTNRSINVKIGGGAERGWSAYSPNLDYQLTEEVQNYQMTFQMQQESDIAARLEFNVGNNENPVWIGNVRLEEIEPVDPYNENAPKTPLRNGNHIYNGTFDLGRIDRLTYWDMETNGAEATPSVDPDVRELLVKIANGGSSKDTIQLRQSGIELLENNDYQLKFQARADADQDIEVALVSKTGEIHYSNSETFKLSTEMEQHEMTFTMSSESDRESQLVFFLGGNNENVVIDNVELIRLTDHQPGLTLDDAFPLKNGQFFNWSYWSSHVQGEYEPGVSNAAFDIVEGELEATIIESGWEPWHVMLEQSGLNLKEKNTYILEFDARSTTDRQIEVVLENNAYERYFNEAVQLTDSMSHYRFEFDMTTDDVVALKFLLGNTDIGEHQIIMDNIRLEVKGEREKYFPLINGSFSEELEGWSPHIQGEHEPGASEATFEVVNDELKATITNAGWEPWHVLLEQKGLQLQAGNTYILELDARSTVDRPVELVLENSAYQRYFDTIIYLTNTTQTFTFEMEMPTDEIVDLKFLLGNVDLDTHEVYLDNVRLEVKGAREIIEGIEDDEDPTSPEPDEDPSEPGNEDDALKDKIEELEEKISELESRIAELENELEIEELEKIIEQLEKQINELETNDQQMRDKLASLEDTIKALKKELDLVKDQLQKSDGGSGQEPKENDDSKKGNGNDPGIQPEESDNEKEIEVNDKNENGTLPNTATTLYQYLLFGLLFMVAGVILFIARKKWWNS